MCFFCIFYFVYGMGSGIVVLDKFGFVKGWFDVDNFCISDNELFVCYFVGEFFLKFVFF